MWPKFSGAKRAKTSYNSGGESFRKKEKEKEKKGGESRPRQRQIFGFIILKSNYLSNVHLTLWLLALSWETIPREIKLEWGIQAQTLKIFGFIILKSNYLDNMDLILWLLILSSVFIRNVNALTLLWFNVSWNFLFLNKWKKKTLHLQNLRGCLVSVFKQQFSVFKQYFTYFNTLFHPCIFIKVFKQQFSVFKHMY